MSEIKKIKEEELNEVAGGNDPGEKTITSAQGLSLGQNVDISFLQSILNIKTTLSGKIVKIKQNSKGAWYYLINMDESAYTGWYFRDYIFCTFKNKDSLLKARHNKEEIG